MNRTSFYSRNTSKSLVIARTSLRARIDEPAPKFFEGGAYGYECWHGERQEDIRHLHSIDEELRERGFDVQKHNVLGGESDAWKREMDIKERCFRDYVTDGRSFWNDAA